RSSASRSRAAWAPEDLLGGIVGARSMPRVVGTVACAAILCAAGAQAQEPKPTGATERVIAGRPEYHRSGYFKFHFGEGYRTLWTTPFEAPVLDLRTYAGGLTPVREGGSTE